MWRAIQRRARSISSKMHLSPNSPICHRWTDRVSLATNHPEQFEVAHEYEFGDFERAIQHVSRPGKTGIVLLKSLAEEGSRVEIGTIGAGAFAQAFAKQALTAGNKIKLSNSRGPDSLRKIDNHLGPGATAATKEEAAACEMVLLAVPWDDVPETLASLPEWNKQILIDGTNPFHGRAGEFTLADVGNLSTSQLIAALAPGARVVKALNTIIVPNLEAEPVVNGARRVLFISADDDGAKKKVEFLLAGFGYSVIDLGNLRDGGLIQQAGGPLAGRNLLEEGERHK